MNNMACIYKTRGELRVAMSFLEEAIRLKKQSNDEDLDISDLFLNICAVFSKMNKHHDALEASVNATFLIIEQLLNKTLPIYNYMLNKLKDTDISESTEFKVDV